MSSESGRRILGHFPVRHFTDFTGSGKPFVPEPSSATTPFGIADYKLLIAMGGDPGLIAYFFD